MFEMPPNPYQYYVVSTEMFDQMTAWPTFCTGIVDLNNVHLEDSTTLTDLKSENKDAVKVTSPPVY